MKSKRILIIGLLALAIAGYFWTQSRYPALNEKALMGGRVQTQGLSFDVVLETSPSMPLVQRVSYSTVNWLYTNKQGMTFAIFFGAAVLTFLKLVRWRGKSNVFFNSVKGVMTGTPMGVCANCVAPIGKGMYDAGTRVETVLSAMISSPTMNIIVLTMLFSLFSYSFAFIKVLFTLVFVLIFIPLMTQLFFSKENKKNTNVQKHETSPINESWKEALQQSFKLYLKDLWYLIKMTVPLMLVAGLLGSFFIEVLPLEKFVYLEDNWIIASLFAVLAGILPVPMTFDIIVAFSLKSAGLSTGLTMVFLFASGTFSVYPFFILWKTISKKVALTMMIATILFSLAAGYIAQTYEDYQVQKALDLFDEYFENNPSV